MLYTKWKFIAYLQERSKLLREMSANQVHTVHGFSHVCNPPHHLCFRQAMQCLITNEKAKQIGQKMQIAYRQPQNLKKLVTGLPRKGEGESEADPGCFKCKKKCHACKILKEGKYLYSQNTGKRYTIKQNVSCESSFVMLEVWVTICGAWGCEYVNISIQTISFTMLINVRPVLPLQPFKQRLKK